MQRLSLLLALLCPLTLPLSAPAEEGKPRYDQRWVYCAFNLQVNKQADDLIALIDRAAKAGYNGVVLADYKLSILDRVPEHYFKNAERVKEAAAKAKVELIPAVFPVGYSAGLLAHDPNLAEGLPVKDAPFVVKGRDGAPAPDSGPNFVNGGLEDLKSDNVFRGFSFQDDPGKTTFADREVVHGGKVSCRMQDVTGNCRLSQRVKVRPFACYRFSCWVKTKDFQVSGEFKLLALPTRPDSPALTYSDTHLKPTQDWTQYDVVFNSLDNTEVQLYVGQWGGKKGIAWIDDIALEELSLVNILRRPGCPLTVTSDDGKTVYEEGKDFEAVRDPKLGMEPYAGEYSFRHAGPTLRLTENSRIKDRDKLRLSWYHPILTHEYQVMCCLSDPKVYEILRDQAKRVNDLLKPATYFMSHDEMRVAGWCRGCQEGKHTPGELLAENVSRCVKIVKEINPKARIVVWSDMFDPNHNAVDKYYLVRGTLAESWKGLPEDVMIANWNEGKAKESLKWFADRGHGQIIAGYYDGDLDNFRKWTEAAKGVPKVSGFMYTTWQNKYDLLEAYGKAMTGKD